ncbi:MAG TPA: hypothetical protein VN976_12205 [Verrucomicrobiae bacterium]|nr:hypothetical protein [Verrucomicrobiae bacterium]
MHRAGTTRAIAAAMERSTKVRGRCTLTLAPSHWRPALLLVASFLGCGGLVGSGPPPPPPAVTVTVAPASASVPLGEPQTFTATVSNAASTAVSWSVNGIPGGNVTVGTVDAGGVYTAPAILPSPASVSVQAASTADSSKTSASMVTITSDISVSVSPGSIPVELGATRPFTATVNSAGNPNRSVTWALSGSGCAGAACGTVDSSGTYTAPQISISPPVVSLTAVSVADPSRSGTATINVTSSFSLSVSGPSTLTTGSTATYAAKLTPAPNSNPSLVIFWSVSGTGCTGAACGTISSSGAYATPSIPPSPATVQIVATPLANPLKTTSVSLFILPAVSVSVSPSAATVALGGAQTFQATVTGAQDMTVTWDVNGAVDGNPTAGSILNSQIAPNITTYNAPQTMPAGGSVTVNARSNANPNVSASATITFSSAVSVTLMPVSATLAVSHRQTFAALVNNTPNQNVAWLVNGISGGNSVMGQICVQASNPCQPVSASAGGSVDYVAPAGVPSPDPVNITATSQAIGAPSASASVTVLPHVVVSVQPGSVTIASAGQMRFAATVTGTSNQQVIWSVTGIGCANPGVCGSIDSTGLFTAPPLPVLINVVATSLEDTTQSGTAFVTINNGPGIFSLSPASAYAGSAGGFTLLVSGNNFSPSNPGPGSTILVAGAARATSCASSIQCITSLEPSDLQSAENLPVQLENPNGLLSNTQAFVVLAPGAGGGGIPLTPSAPTSTGNDIVVVELSTNGGSGAAGNVTLNIGAIGAYSVATSSCVLGGSPVVIQRPASGKGTADLCVFSVSALDPSFNYTISGPPTPDITVSNREPLGLGILHLTLQVPATAAPGPRTLFVENPEKDKAAGTGAIEVR